MPRFGLSFGNPDFVKLAESFGALGFRVEKKEDFESILSEAMLLPGLKLIDVPFEYPQKIQ